MSLNLDKAQKMPCRRMSRNDNVKDFNIVGEWESHNTTLSVFNCFSDICNHYKKKF